jgi:hypothetical protein
METYFEVAELRKLFAAVIESTQVRLGLIVDDLVGANVAALGESLPADFTLVWAFSGVPSFVRLESFLVNMEIQIMALHLLSGFQVERNCGHSLALCTAAKERQRQHSRVKCRGLWYSRMALPQYGNVRGYRDAFSDRNSWCSSQLCIDTVSCHSSDCWLLPGDPFA